MKRNHLATSVCAMLLVVFFAGTVLCRSQVEKLRGKEVTLEEVLYMPSGKSVKRLSLGYSSLLADIYWTRAVQYFGNKMNQGPCDMTCSIRSWISPPILIHT